MITVIEIANLDGHLGNVMKTIKEVFGVSEQSVRIVHKFEENDFSKEIEKPKDPVLFEENYELENRRIGEEPVMNREYKEYEHLSRGYSEM